MVFGLDNDTGLDRTDKQFLGSDRRKRRRLFEPPSATARPRFSFPVYRVGNRKRRETSRKRIAGMVFSDDLDKGVGNMQNGRLQRGSPQAEVFREKFFIFHSDSKIAFHKGNQANETERVDLERLVRIGDRR